MSELIQAPTRISPIVNVTAVMLSDLSVFFFVCKQPKNTRVASESPPRKEVTMWPNQQNQPLRGSNGFIAATVESRTPRVCSMPMTTVMKLGASWSVRGKNHPGGP